MPYKNVKKLIHTVEKKKRLGSMVKTLVVDKSVRSYLPSRNVVDIPASLPNLTTWHDASSRGHFQGVHCVLQSVTCDVYEIPSKTINLVDLRIRDSSGQLVREYRLFAQNMIESKGYEKLRKLYLEPNVILDHAKTPFGPHSVQKTPPQWLYFIVEFNLANIKLSLTSLALCGDITGRSQQVVSILRRGIDLGGVNELVLNHFENPHNVLLPTVLELITKYTRSLESLAVYSTTDHHKEQEEAMSRAFRNNIPNQLKKLYISFKTPKIFAANYRKLMADTIAMCQRNLVAFKYEDGYDYVAADKSVSELKQVASEQAEFMKAAWSAELQKQQLFPRIFDDLHARPRISSNHAEFIEKFKGVLQRCLQNERINSHFARYLPLLTQCYIGKLFIDPRRYGVYVNDGVVLFESKSRPTFDPREPEMIEDYTPSD